MAVEIVHWNPVRNRYAHRVGLRRMGPLADRLPGSSPVNNFGDLLGPILTNEIINSMGLPADSGTGRLVTIGSILHLTQPGDVVWGSGVNGKVPNALGAAPELLVRAVRGPLTQAALRKAGTDVPSVYGDPALLWPRYWAREWYARRSGRSTPYVVVPNLHDWPRYRRHPYAVNPCRADPHHVIARIAAADFVVGSSLHGLILAEAFGIPARALRPATEPPFKYDDYYRGTGRSGHRAADTIEEALRLGGEPTPEWDPAPLLAAFPAELWRLPSDAPGAVRP